MHSIPKYCIVALLTFAVLLAAKVNGQTTASGGLAGVVVDQTHAVIPDAVVEITDLAKGTIESARTDSQGVYPQLFPGLPSCSPVTKLPWMRRVVIASVAARSPRGAPT
jgi:hypothetical protein